MNSEKTAGPSNPGKAASIFFQLTMSHSLLPIWNASQQAPVPQAKLEHGTFEEDRRQAKP